MRGVRRWLKDSNDVRNAGSDAREEVIGRGDDFSKNLFLAIFKHEYINIPPTVQSLLFFYAGPSLLFRRRDVCTKFILHEI